MMTVSPSPYAFLNSVLSPAGNACVTPLRNARTASLPFFTPETPSSLPLIHQLTSSEKLASAPSMLPPSSICQVRFTNSLFASVVMTVSFARVLQRAPRDLYDFFPRKRRRCNVRHDPHSGTVEEGRGR